MELVAEGSDIQSLADYEPLFQEGEKGHVQIYLDRELSELEVGQLAKELVERGVVLTRPIIYESRMLSIGFEKRTLPLVPIAIAVIGVLGTGFLGWQLFKPSWGAPLGIPMGVWAVGAALLGLLVYMGVKE